MLTRLRARVGDRASEADIVAHDIDAGRILEEVVHVCLTNAESSVNVPAIVSLATFGHAAVLLGSRYLPRIWQAAGLGTRREAQPIRSAATGSVFVARRGGM
jgi:hypothetical protein